MPARTPVDRDTERTYSPSRKETIEPKKVDDLRVDNQAHARNFLDCVKSPECEDELRHTDGILLDARSVAGEYFSANEIVS